MSKVICDVCGTTYPETASSCPICGCAKNTTAQTAADSAQQADGETGYTYVKGGRFSKSNVRKRNKRAREKLRAEDPENMQEGGANKGLVIVVLVLLLAIVAVLIYIGVRFFAPNIFDQPTTPSTSQTDPSGTTGNTEPEKIPCTEIDLATTTVELSEAGSSWLISAEALPANTTDKITYTSADETIATVSENGKITAVAGGETVITVTCGEISVECKVVCSFGEPTEPTEPTEPPFEVPAGFELKLNRKDFTLTKEGESWTLFKETNGVKPSDITWTSEDTDVAIVEDGKVTGVNYGDTKITATVGDQTVSCIVRVRFRSANTGNNQEGGENEGGETTAPGVKISATDVTISVGETFSLELKDAQQVPIQVEWTASEEGFVTIEGKKITGVSNGGDGKVKSIKVSTTYEGKTYECIVRVKAKAE